MWNSRWCSPIGLTQSDLLTSLSHGTADWFSPVSVANELAAQHLNIWLVLAVAVCSMLQKPSTFPTSTCIDLLWGDSYKLYAVPIPDLWGPYAKLCCGGAGRLLWKNGWNAFVRVSLHLESRLRKALEKQYLFCGSVRFQRHSRYMIWLIFT